MEKGEEGRLTRTRPKLLTIALVFLGSFGIFYYVPPLLLGIPLVASFFYLLGGYNATFHMLILEALGVESMASANLLHLASGAVVEYSPYCFGILTITAFIILAFYAPTFNLKERIRWIAWASLILVIVNQGRIVLELILASALPSSLSTVDIVFYPLLPSVALYIWYHGLKSREHLFSVGGKGHARG
jgi:hypothetical protein